MGNGKIGNQISVLASASMALLACLHPSSTSENRPPPLTSPKGAKSAKKVNSYIQSFESISFFAAEFI